jgi:hypothetical protein
MAKAKKQPKKLDPFNAALKVIAATRKAKKKVKPS